MHVIVPPVAGMTIKAEGIIYILNPLLFLMTSCYARANAFVIIKVDHDLSLI